MHVIDRFTRDDVSAKVWWPLAMVLVVLFIVTFPAYDRERDRIHVDAEEQAVGLVAQVVDPALAEVGGVGALDPIGLAALDEILTDDVLDEIGEVRAIRTWAADGRLVSSTDEAEAIGSEAAVNDEQIDAAMGAPNRSVAFTTSAGLSGGEGPPAFVVYRALETADGVVAQIEYDDELLLSAADARWFAWRVVLGVATLLTFGLALLSMREPLARSGAGVTFYPTSVPPGAAVIDGDDAAVLRQAGAHARRRIQEMQARMEELDLDKVRLEGELQRALSTRAMGAAAPSAAIPRPAQRSPEVPVVHLPEPDERLEPSPAEAETPAAPPADVAPVVAEPPVVPIPDPDVEAARPPARTHQPRPVPQDSWAAGSAPAPVVKVPDVQGSPDSDEDVIEVLNRLVEPVGPGAANADAASDMRARLARTAARKKPGSRSDDRFEHHDPE